MNTTAKRIRIGSKIILGKYTAGDGEPQPITWLKATPNCDFISEFAIDYLCFDAREPYNPDRFRSSFGSREFELSNLCSFLNSDQDQWYTPTHAMDNHPAGNRNIAYANHPGFLFFFEDYELSEIFSKTYEVNGASITSLIRLPLSQEIAGEHKFSLFRKKGYRPHPSQDLCRSKRLEFSMQSFIPFWCMDHRTERVFTINRTGDRVEEYPSNGSGVRPVCTINPETILHEVSADTYQIILPETNPDNFWTKEEMLTLLEIE